MDELVCPSGKFIVSNEIKINIEGELVEAKESETAGSASS